MSGLPHAKFVSVFPAETRAENYEPPESSFGTQADPCVPSAASPPVGEK